MDLKLILRLKVWSKKLKISKQFIIQYIQQLSAEVEMLLTGLQQDRNLEVIY